MTQNTHSEDDAWIDELDNSDELGLSVLDYESSDDDNYQSDYFQGAHYYLLFEQEGDASQMTESAGTYDEAYGPNKIQQT